MEKISALAASLSLFGKQRMGRLAYARNSTIAVVVAVVPSFALFIFALGIAWIIGDEAWANFVSASHLDILFVVFVGISFVLGLAIHYFAVYQRYHDLNKGEHFLVMTIVPFANIYYWFKLLFAKGINEGNEYGEPPPPATHRALIIASFVLAAVIMILLRLIIGFGISNTQ